MQDLKCDKCERTFPSPQSLAVHRFRAHTEQGKALSRKISLNNSKRDYTKQNKRKTPKPIIFDVTTQTSTTFQKKLKEHENLLIQISKEYSDGVGVKWKNAFTEHPEWAATIGFDGTQHFLTKLYYWSKLYRAKEHKQKKLERKQMRENRTIESSHRLQFDSEASEVNYCPKCGTPLKLEEAAAKAIKRMMGKGLDETKIIEALSAMTRAVEKL